MSDVQPVATGRHKHENVTELVMRRVPVRQFPSHPIVSGESAFAKDSLHVSENGAVHEHPEMVEVADGEDMETDTDLARDTVVSVQVLRRLQSYCHWQQQATTPKKQRENRH